MPRATRHLCHTLSELGWLFLRVQRYVKEGLDNPQLGRVAHALCAVLQEELAEYYRCAAANFIPQKPSGFSLSMLGSFFSFVAFGPNLRR